MSDPVLVAVITGAAIIIGAVVQAVSNRRTRNAVTKLKVEVNGQMEKLLKLTSDAGYAAGERHERERDHTEDDL